MAILGIASLGHDASVTLINNAGAILFAGHAERYSRIKNDGLINQPLLDDMLRYGTPERIVWYERPWLKRSRMLLAGQPGALSGPSPREHVDTFPALRGLPISKVGHHEAHAAAGFLTSPFERAAVLVVDAIGEWDTISLWIGEGNTLKKCWSQRYPHSLGLLYSAFTQRCGFKPNEEEYILMGMAAYGQPTHVDLIDRDLIETRKAPHFRLKENVHRGIRDWRPELTDPKDIAASIQKLTEDYLVDLAAWAREETGMRHLVMMGGVALNCVANARIAREGGFDEIWIMPNPGDAGSSLGAAACAVNKRLWWENPYLGYDIGGEPRIAEAVAALARGEVIGWAHGRAEFGPRALGNRSLLADPRGPEVKDRVNRIKKRELFRPFAPAILADHAASHFDMPVRTAPYMQFTAPVLRPDLFPAISHVDGTARVQTVTHSDNPVFCRLLEAFYAETGCPMLLNTSLNIKGEPLVNDREDADRFAAKYGVTVY